jgi:hypothetical protein
MFVQVMTGRTSDPDALQRQLEIWKRDLQPGAIGYLGSTSGCTSDGDVIMLARFEDEDAAMRNSQRPEQSAWWKDTEKCFDGPVTFHDTEDVELNDYRGIDQATFVQVMEGTVNDRQRADQLEHELDDAVVEGRPDVLGHLTAHFGDRFDEFVYFTSEAEARRAESGQMPEEVQARMAEMDQAMTVERYYDLSEPWVING